MASATPESGDGLTMALMSKASDDEAAVARDSLNTLYSEGLFGLTEAEAAEVTLEAANVPSRAAVAVNPDDACSNSLDGMNEFIGW